MSDKENIRLLENYLTELRDIHSSGAGVPETSYYTPLSNLLNGVGKTLKPRVHCIINLKNRGAGIPDGGLFTKDQLPRGDSDEPPPDTLPARGAIEVKGTSDEVREIAESEQVKKYLKKYRQVLVTDLRDFLLIGADSSGNPIALEGYTIAKSESEFWSMASTPVKTAKEHGERFIEYLVRAILHAAPLNDPEEVARFLASYAREAKARIEEKGGLPGLALLREALENTLGLKFEGEDGERFFRATLVQTLFYGIFSSWVLWARGKGRGPDAKFNWHEAAWNLHVPMIAGLFNQIATPQQLKPLGLDEVLDWTGNVLNRVVRSSFFDKFEETHAVQYFYEPFLKAYDPELRKELGVWYTPREIVKYQVARVDTVLREELDIADGLADPRVYVLDPCCGTGAYLVEVIEKIHETLKEKGEDALLPQKLKKAVMERILGFEILPAPFVVSHLQIGLLLRNLGAPLSDDINERAGVYLTNALTGWEPPKKPKDQIPLPFQELQEEKDAAEKVKRETPILVILGNPPYNAFAGTSPDEEEGLVDVYKEGLNKPAKDGGWGIKKFNLDDLYIRFFRIAERRIVKGGRGIVSYISNYSWVSEPSFVVLRKRLLEVFDKIWIENMHGNRKISEYAPDGRTSETVFAISGFSPGIQQGVVTSLWVKKGESKKKQATILFRDDTNAAKAAERRKQLLDSLKKKNFDKQYKIAKPDRTNRLSFKPLKVAKHFLRWPLMVDLCAKKPSNGLMEKRGGALIKIDRETLEKRMKIYFDKNITWDSYQKMGMGLERNRAGIDPKKVRDKAIKEDVFNSRMIVRYAIRAFDVIWAYYSRTPGVWNRSRPAYWEQNWNGNKFLMTRPAGVANPEGVPIFYSTVLGDNDFQRGHSYYFPFFIKKKNNNNNSNNTIKLPGFEEDLTKEKIRANLSVKSKQYLDFLRVKHHNEDPGTAGLIWVHTLAIGFSPAYLSENADGIRQDWPRIPLPDSKAALESSAELGRRVAALLDTEEGVSGVTTGKIRAELKTLGVVKSVSGPSLDPGKGDLELTAGWGHGGKDGVCMPGKGRVIAREYLESELAEIKKGCGDLGLSFDSALEQLGKTTCDIYLNDKAYWANVPVNLWNYYIGGYQVIKKWLSYREKAVLGRSLKMEEVEYITETVRRLAAIILLQPALDENYRKVKESTYSWPAE